MPTALQAIAGARRLPIASSLIALPLTMFMLFTLFAGLLAGVLAVPGGAAHAAAVGTVSEVQLTAFGRPPAGAREEKNLTDGVVMREVLETVPDGGLRVGLIDDTTLTLGGAASLIVDEMVFDPTTKDGNSVLNLMAGTFLYVSGSMTKSGIRIETPTTVIGVRGTKLLIKIDPDGRTSVGVVEGAADVRSRIDGAVASIEPGDSAIMPPSGGFEIRDLAAVEVRDLFVASAVVREATETVKELEAALTSEVATLQAELDAAGDAAVAEAEALVASLEKELSVAGDIQSALEQREKLIRTAVAGTDTPLLDEGTRALDAAAGTVPTRVEPAKAAAAGAADSVRNLARQSNTLDLEATDLAKDAVKQAVDGAVDAAKDAAVEAAKVAAVDAAKNAATEAAKVVAVDAAKDAAVDAATEAAKVAAVDAAKDAAVDAATEAATEAAKDAATEAAKDAAVDAATEAAKDAAVDAATEAAKDAATEAATEAAKDAVVEAAKDAAIEAAEDAAKEAATAVVGL